MNRVEQQLEVSGKHVAIGLPAVRKPVAVGIPAVGKPVAVGIPAVGTVAVGIPAVGTVAVGRDVAIGILVIGISVVGERLGDRNFTIDRSVGHSFRQPCRRLNLCPSQQQHVLKLSQI